MSTHEEAVAKIEALAARMERGEGLGSPGLIFERLNLAMRQIGAIGKDHRNEKQGFMFRGIDQAMNAAHSVFAENQIFVTKTILERTTGQLPTKSGGTMFTVALHIRYRFSTIDGSSVETEASGVGYDTGDKADNKAMSVGLKYALFEILMIPTQEQKDPDADSPGQEIGAPAAKKKPQKRKPAPAPEKPAPEASSAPSPEPPASDGEWDLWKQAKPQAMKVYARFMEESRKTERLANDNAIRKTMADYVRMRVGKAGLEACTIAEAKEIYEALLDATELESFQSDWLAAHEGEGE